MNVLLGIGVIGVGLGFAGMILGVLTDRDLLTNASVALIAVVVAVGVVGFGLFVAFGGDTGPSLREGSCYRAYGKDSYMPVTTTSGKVTTTTVVPMHSVDLAEITCP